jgi:hypothetical protein
MNDVRQEFWGDLQADLYVKNTAVYLANQSLSELISDTGYKAHKPILSHPQVGTYTAHSDISFESKGASKQTLQVDTFEYAAEDIDITESKQSPYDLVSHSLKSIRNGLMNGVEQKFLSEISNADHDINSGTALEVTSANVLDILEEAEGILGSFDAPYETAMRAAVLGPRTVATLRRSKSDRESRIGDSVLSNGVVGPWQGWTVVQSNNLPWSGTLELATNPSDGDTVTIAGVTFEWQDNLADVTTGNVGVLRDGSAVDTSRANLVACINDSGTAGTNYVQMGAKANFIIRRKRRITATNDNSNDEMTLAGFGDIAVSDSLTDTTDCWNDEEQTGVFMIRGSIDMVLQFMDLKVADKEKGFADLPKGIIGVGTEVFDDGAVLMVKLTQDVSGW